MQPRPGTGSLTTTFCRYVVCLPSSVFPDPTSRTTPKPEPAKPASSPTIFPEPLKVLQRSGQPRLDSAAALLYWSTMTETLTAAQADTTTTTGAWRGFAGEQWKDAIDVRGFIQRNYTPYDGDASFLVGPTDRTSSVWAKLTEMFPEEQRQGIYDVDTSTPSTITSHAPGYIDKDREIIVGLQTDAPLKRAIVPNGGWRMVVDSLEAYGREPDPRVAEIFTKYRKTHNDGVFDAYTTRIKKARSSHIITGLPDAYGRGRIIGDYRRVALYGVDRLIEAKQAEWALLDELPSSVEIIRDREELAEQARALVELKQMAASYGYDIGVPARTAREALQWLYFGYLAAVKEQNGAAMSLGRTSTFLDT